MEWCAVPITTLKHWCHSAYTTRSLIPVSVSESFKCKVTIVQLSFQVPEFLLTELRAATKECSFKDGMSDHCVKYITFFPGSVVVPCQAVSIWASPDQCFNTTDELHLCEEVSLWIGALDMLQKTKLGTTKYTAFIMRLEPLLPH